MENLKLRFGQVYNTVYRFTVMMFRKSLGTVSFTSKFTNHQYQPTILNISSNRTLCVFRMRGVFV